MNTHFTSVSESPALRWRLPVADGTRIMIGVFLVVVAYLKMHGYRAFALDGNAWYTAPVIQGTAIIWELLLGAWLLTGRYPLGSWLAAVTTFAIFALVSAWLGLIGKASCGCLGRVADISPWTAFGIDVAALSLLGLFRPDLSALRHQPRAELGRFLAQVGLLVIAAGTLMGLLTMTSTVLFGSPNAALAYLRDEPLSVDPSPVDFGHGTEGQELQATVAIGNWTDSEIRLIGGSTDCTCLTTTSLPITLAAGETKQITIKLHVPPTKTSGRLTRLVEIWTDYDQQRAIRLRVTCRIHRP